MRLNIRMLCAKKLLRAVDRELFDHIHVLAAAVPALCRIPFGVFIGQNRTHRLKNRKRRKIFACDQLDILVLAADFGTDGVINIRVGRFELRQINDAFFHNP